MTPTTVKMAQHVRETFSEEPLSGNIISRPYQGWSNLFQGYLLGTIDLTLGNPRNGSYMIRHWVLGGPRWSQPPHKLYGTGFNAIMAPVQESVEAPPLNAISLPT
jgi:hypothetical protein